MATRRVGTAAISYVGSGQLGTDVGRAATSVPERARTGWDRVRGGWQQFGQDVAQRHGPTASIFEQGAATVQVLDDRLRPGRRNAAISLDAKRRIQYHDPPTALPATAHTGKRHDVSVARLLTLGYQVLDRADGTVAFWKNDAATSGPPTDDALLQQELQQQGALRKRAAIQPTTTSTKQETP